ncbi:hexose carrier protein, partial [Aureobasidium melanogenum]
MITKSTNHAHIEAYPSPGKEKNEHIEVAESGPKTMVLSETQILSYGKNGIAGIVSSGYIFGIAFLASMGGFSFGYDQGVISLILTMEQFHAQFPETAPGHPNQGFYVGFMTGMLELGAFLGCLVYPYVADRWSRKWGLSFAVLWFCVGAIVQTAAQDYGMLVAGRTIGGVGVGTLALGAPLYISEISPPNLRGSLLVLETFSIVIGAVIAYWLTYGTAEISSQWAFRLPFLLQMVPALMVGIGIHFFPFSPRWLCMRARNEEALSSLSTLRRLPSQDIRVQTEWRGIVAEVATMNEITYRKWGDATGLRLELLGWKELFTAKYVRRTAVAAAIPFFQQFSGINAFVYYAPTLFRALGQDEHSSLVLSGMINICQLVWPNSNRAKGVAMAVSVNWISNTIIGITVPPMIESIGFGTYVFFACFCFLATVFSFFFVPETANLNLEEIDRLFRDNSAADEAELQREMIVGLTTETTSGLK